MLVTDWRRCGRPVEGRGSRGALGERVKGEEMAEIVILTTVE